MIPVVKSENPADQCETPVDVLNRTYLLVTFLPSFRDCKGDRWLNQAWHQDLMEHLRYIKDLTLCAPILPKGSEPNLVRVEVPSDARLRYADLPPQTSLLQALLTLPKTAAILWGAIGRVAIVHSGIIGWPYPLGWIANPITVLRRKSLVLVVESSWRRRDTERTTWKTNIWDAVSGVVARWSCKRANVVFFTQPTYRTMLHRGARGAAYITPAVWINEDDILHEAAADGLWIRKVNQPVRLLFAGRLEPGKGVDVLLQALRILDGRGINARVDIIGDGQRRQACERAAKNLGNVHLSVLEQVPYGDPFFELVRGYHAVLVPSLTDEQPRIVFDSNAQAVAIIGSDTPGLRPHVENGRTGWLLPCGDAEALAKAIEYSMENAPKLRRMGMEALAATYGYTHVAMHRHRFDALRQHFT